MEVGSISVRCDCGAGQSLRYCENQPCSFSVALFRHRNWQRILGTWRCPQCCEEKEEQDRVVDAKRTIPEGGAVVTIAARNWQTMAHDMDIETARCHLVANYYTNGEQCAAQIDCRILKVETRKETDHD